jgi:hypothetical protein
MNLRQICSGLALANVTADDKLDREVAGCYAGDLLSCAMAGARKNDVWLTVQAHANIVAVAVLLDLAAIIITEGAKVDAPTLERAQSEGVVLLSTGESTYDIAGKLWEMGIRNSG